MKKISIFCLGLILMLLSQNAAAQLSLSVTPQSHCLGLTQTFSVTTAPGGVTSYSWDVTSPSGGAVTVTNHTTTTGVNGTIYFYACGIYTTTCWAMNGTSVVATTTITNTILCQPTVTASGVGTVCAGSSATLTGSGASTYTWYTSSGPFSSANPLVVTPTASICYTLTGSNTSGCTGAQIACVGVSSTPITISSSGNNLCGGGSATLTASGGSSYTWMPGGMTGSSIVVSPTSNTCYTVTGINSCGTGTMSVVNCISVSSPTVSVSGGTATCGGSTVLHASGASSYVWSNGATTANITAGPGCYTVVGTSGSCTSSAVQCISSLPSPTITIAGNSTVCGGTYNALTASGASTYTWSNGSTGATINGNANTCYTLVGINASGCSGTAVHCVTVLPSPTVTIAGSATVCAGTSINLTASGAISYNWNTGATTSTINVPTSTASPSSTLFVVMGTGSNGCHDSAAVVVYVNSGCADVWPGDANSDGVVNSSDILELGLAFSNTGAARASISNVYTAQHATTWSGTGSTGANKCHVDCNGDGTVNDDDTLAIYNNYSLTHSFRPSGASSIPDISYDQANTYLVAGEWNTIDILLGSSANTVSQLYGLTFDVNYDPAMVEPDSAYLSYSSSFLNASNHNVQFRKSDFTNGKIIAASVRTDHSNVNGNGVIAQLHLKLKPGTANSDLNLSFSNTEKINATGTPASLNNQPAALPVNATSPVGLNSFNLSPASVQVFPNPANGKVTLRSYNNGELSYTVCDMAGRSIANGTFNGSKTLDISQFENGIYIVKIEAGSSSVFKKLVVEK